MRVSGGRWWQDVLVCSLQAASSDGRHFAQRRGSELPILSYSCSKPRLASRGVLEVSDHLHTGTLRLLSTRHASTSSFLACIASSWFSIYRRTNGPPRSGQGAFRAGREFRKALACGFAHDRIDRLNILLLRSRTRAQSTLRQPACTDHRPRSDEQGCHCPTAETVSYYSALSVHVLHVQRPPLAPLCPL